MMELCENGRNRHKDGTTFRSMPLAKALGGHKAGVG